MNDTLRDRRRRQTARDIQLAALRLSLNMGYASVTTESIASEAGISPRTFFNYYANKQSAILGEVPALRPEDACWIIHSRNPLVEDLARLLGAILDNKHLDRKVVRMMEKVWETTPELVVVFRNSLDNIALAIGDLLAQRLGPGRETEAALIAGLSIHVLSYAVRSWAADETMTTGDLLPLMRRQLHEICRLLEN